MGGVPTTFMGRGGLIAGAGHPRQPARIVQDWLAPRVLGEMTRPNSSKRFMSWNEWIGSGQSRHSTARPLAPIAGSPGDVALGDDSALASPAAASRSAM